MAERTGGAAARSKRARCPTAHKKLLQGKGVQTPSRNLFPMASIRNLLLVRDKHRQLRTQLFPDVTDDQLWERRTKTGFATIPRAFPLLMVLMDELSLKQPVSSTYFALWCRAWDNPLVVIGSRLVDLAAEAGFAGQRAQNTLAGRLAILADLGLVRFAPGPGGKYSYALLLNPYLALEKHKKKLSEYNWNALLGRVSEIGATDFDPPQPDLFATTPPAAPPAAAAEPVSPSVAPKPPRPAPPKTPRSPRKPGARA